MRFFLALALATHLVTTNALGPIRRDDSSASATISAPGSVETTFNPGQIPACAQDCYSKARNQTSDCPSGQISCLCVQPEVSGFLASCLEASCDTGDLESAAQYGTALCRAIIKSEQSASSSASPSATATSAEASSETPSSTSSEPASSTASESASSSGASESSTAASETSSAVSSAASTASSDASSSTASGSSANVVVVTSTSTAPVNTAAAAVSSGQASSSRSASASGSLSSSSGSTSGALSSYSPIRSLWTAGIVVVGALVAL